MDTLTAWSRTWQMEFNITKCKILQVSTHCTKSLYSYQMCGFPLEIVEQLIRVCLHHRLSWQFHIDFICNKANRLLGFLHRNLRHCPSKLKEWAWPYGPWDITFHGVQISLPQLCSNFRGRCLCSSETLLH